MTGMVHTREGPEVDLELLRARRARVRLTNLPPEALPTAVTVRLANTLCISQYYGHRGN